MEASLGSVGLKLIKSSDTGIGWCHYGGWHFYIEIIDMSSSHNMFTGSQNHLNCVRASRGSVGSGLFKSQGII